MRSRRHFQLGCTLSQIRTWGFLGRAPPHRPLVSFQRRAEGTDAERVRAGPRDAVRGCGVKRAARPRGEQCLAVLGLAALGESLRVSVKQRTARESKIQRPPLVLPYFLSLANAGTHVTTSE